MALLHQAELTPSKLELIAAWLPAQAWFRDPTTEGLARVAAYRFDDPAGEVGIEALLVRVGDGPVYQVALTYRGAPLAGAEPWLVGTTDHSVLGKRWVYDACGDPVYATVLAGALLGTTRQAEEFLEVEGSLVPRKPLMTVTTVPAAVPAAGPAADGGSSAGAESAVGADSALGAVHEVVSGDPTVIETGVARLAVVHVLGGTPRPNDAAVLIGHWDGSDGSVLLAYATR
ncbi:hypothetical protein ACFFX1_27700 [Dactylosporangium sucinum]|uniref:Maltokinase N-terminal cap domain-containing protein n=1 Tax=Dactylosporangium sucinum TaxID=1424081 RepID=A0A917UEX9_9ACTN|nr:hypothetical protein [Dactylosporangium sucinum]GGM84375.1 hypothetical protein GCM10007977_102390 [Dactylosporangium sucinum]